MSKILSLTGAAVFALSIVAMGTGPAVADHGDCITNARSGKTVDVPEAAGNNDDFRKGGTQVAEETGNTPLSGSLGPCAIDPPFPSVGEIPGQPNENDAGGPN